MLNNSALLVSLSIGQPKLTRSDREATTDVCFSNQAAAGAAKVVKNLFDPADYKPITQLIGQIRTVHYARTLPWLDSGARILSNAGFLAYTQEVSKYRAEFDKLTAAFCADYSDKLDRAKAVLGSLYRAADYPSVEEVRSRFTFDVNFSPIPQGSDFRVEGIEEAQKALIQAELDKRQVEATEKAMEDVADRIREAVGNLAGKLTETRKAKDGSTAPAIFRDSLVDNVIELVDLLPTLNLTGDPEITRIGIELKKKLKGITAESLRSSDSLRAKTAREAQSIVDKLGGLFDVAA
jgi:hypothetical protein